MVDTPNQDTPETKDYLNMPDDDFLTINSPDAPAAVASESEDDEDAGSVVAEPVAESAADADATKTDADVVVKPAEQDGGKVDNDNDNDDDNDDDEADPAGSAKPVEKLTGEQTKNEADKPVVAETRVVTTKAFSSRS